MSYRNLTSFNQFSYNNMQNFKKSAINDDVKPLLSVSDNKDVSEEVLLSSFITPLTLFPWVKTVRIQDKAFSRSSLSTGFSW